MVPKGSSHPKEEARGLELAFLARDQTSVGGTSRRPSELNLWPSCSSDTIGWLRSLMSAYSPAHGGLGGIGHAIDPADTPHRVTEMDGCGDCKAQPSPFSISMFTSPSPSSSPATTPVSGTPPSGPPPRGYRNNVVLLIHEFEWIARFFAALSLDVENDTLSSVGTVRDDMIKATQGTPRSVLEKAFKKQSKHPLNLEPSEVSDEPQTNGGIKVDEVKENPSQVVLEDIFGVPAISPDSLQGLDRWENTDLESAVSTGRLSRLLQCIAAAEEIQRQAFLILRQLMAIVEA